MRIQRNRYNYPRRWFGRRALVVDDHELTVIGWLGIRWRIPWSKVCGVRRSRHGQAQVELAGGKLLDLPGSGERLDQLIGTLSRECVEEQAELRARAEARGMPGVDVMHHDPNAWARWLGPALIVLTATFPANTPAHDMKYAWLALAASVGWTIAGWLQLLQEIHVDPRGISSRSRRYQWMLYWPEVLEVHWLYWGKHRSSVRITFVTRNRRYVIQGPRRKFEPVARVAEHIVAMNTAEFLPDDGGVPQTGLSPARLREVGSERGLSQTFR